MWEKIWNWIEHERFTVILPTAAIILWTITGISCVPVTSSPIRPEIQLDATELQLEFMIWQKQQEEIILRFDYARQDIEKQKEQLNSLQDTLLQLASGCVTTWSGALQLLVASGSIGLLLDNVRKNGVIGGLKKNG